MLVLLCHKAAAKSPSHPAGPGCPEAPVQGLRVTFQLFRKGAGAAQHLQRVEGDRVILPISAPVLAMKLKPGAGVALSDEVFTKYTHLLLIFIPRALKQRWLFRYVCNYSVSLSILSFSLSVMKELVVSAGDSVEVTLPKNEVQLNAFVLPEPPPGKASLGLQPRAGDGEKTSRHYKQH